MIPCMPLIDQITTIESRIRAMGFSVAAVLRRAGVQKATWSRWKSGRVSPMMATWDRVVDEVDRLEKGIGR